MHSAIIKLQLEQKLQEIQKILTKEYKQNLNVGVLSGISGIALFHFYYSKYLNVDTYADIGVEILEEVIERINNGYAYPTFCTGIAGAGWVFEHLLEEDFTDIDNDDLLANLDDYLFATMQSDMQQGEYDFLHAGIGYGYYFLKRYKNTQSTELKKRYKKYLDTIISELGSIAQKDNDGLKWESNFGKDSQLNGFNLSLSHGMSSIIIFLAKLHQIKSFKDSTYPLLTGAVNYVRSKEVQGENLYCLYPTWIATNASQENTKSRLAWCYGDLGIGLAFWHASKTLKDNSLKNDALKILTHATKRKTDEDTLVMDAGVCHGSYGNAQIFNYLFKETNQLIFKEAAYYWIESGLKKATHTDGYAGYKQWNGMDNSWQAELILLEGIAGIGLVIIDYISDFESKWDECLMIS